MSSFTLGGSGGATLGGGDGGTLGNAYERWRIGGQIIGSTLEEIATFRGLEITVRCTRGQLIDTLRALEPDAGKVDVLPKSDGSFVAVDRADGNNSFDFDPPDARKPLRESLTYLVKAYDEELIETAGDEYDVTLELVRPSARDEDPDDTLSDDPGRATSDDWVFEIDRGDVVTDRVAGELLGSGAAGVERVRLLATMTAAQALVFEASLAWLDGMRVRDIADGENRVVDETRDAALGRNTIELTSPDGGLVNTTTWVASEWASRRINDSYQRIEAEIIRSALIFESASVSATATPRSTDIARTFESAGVTATAAPSASEITRVVEAGSVTPTAVPSASEQTMAAESARIDATAVPRATEITSPNILYNEGTNEGDWGSNVIASFNATSTFSKEVDRLRIEASTTEGDWAGSWTTLDQVDLTPYSTLTVEWEVATNDNADTQRVGVTDNADGDTAFDAETTETGTMARRTDTIDVSAINSSKYVAMRGRVTAGVGESHAIDDRLYVAELT